MDLYWKKEPWADGRTGQGSEAPRLRPLPPTSDGGLAPAVGLHCAPSATFVEQSFLDQPRVQKTPLCEQRNFGSSAPALSANAQTYFSDRLLAGCRLCRSGPRPPFLHPGAALT